MDGVCLKEETIPASFNGRHELFKALPTDDAAVTSIILFLLMLAVVMLNHVTLDLHYKRMIRRQLRDGV